MKKLELVLRYGDIEVSRTFDKLENIEQFFTMNSCDGIEAIDEVPQLFSSQLVYKIFPKFARNYLSRSTQWFFESPLIQNMMLQIVNELKARRK